MKIVENFARHEEMAIAWLESEARELLRDLRSAGVGESKLQMLVGDLVFGLANRLDGGQVRLGFVGGDDDDELILSDSVLHEFAYDIAERVFTES